MSVERRGKLAAITEASLVDGGHGRQVAASEPISLFVDDQAVEVVVLDAQRPFGQLVTTPLRVGHDVAPRVPRVVAFESLLPTGLACLVPQRDLRLAKLHSDGLDRLHALPLDGIVWRGLDRLRGCAGSDYSGSGQHASSERPRWNRSASEARA